jgi:small basic protein
MDLAILTLDFRSPLVFQLTISQQSNTFIYIMAIARIDLYLYGGLNALILTPLYGGESKLLSMRLFYNHSDLRRVLIEFSFTWFLQSPD